MGTWALIQIVFDIFAALGIFVIVMRMSRAPKDDPRLSRGLQLLQSKIAVIEDLSDRTEVQVNQLTALLDQKAKEVQAKIQLAENSVHEIKVAMQNSLEVAKIFQDKIPHQEIIERKNSIKYVQAARLAHQGLSVDDIAAKVDLPKGEIEFISKVNRDRLMFNEEHLPAWAKEEMDAAASGAGEVSTEATGETSPRTSLAGETAVAPAGQLEHLSFEETPDEQAARFRAEIEIAERQRLVENLSRLQFEMQSLDMQLAREAQTRNLTAAFEPPKVNADSLHKLGEEFRKACEEAKESKPALPPLSQLTSLIPQMFQSEEKPPAPVSAAAPAPARSMPSADSASKAASAGKPQPVVRKVVFPRIENNEI